MESISCHITPLVINSLGEDTHTHAHAHVHTDFRTESILGTRRPAADMHLVYYNYLKCSYRHSVLI